MPRTIAFRASPTEQAQAALAALTARHGQAPDYAADVIVALGNPAAQAMVTATRRIPVVFSAVTDPVEVNLVPAWQPSGTNVTGVSDLIPMYKQLDLVKQARPNARRIGMVHTQSEPNARASFKQMQEAASKVGMTLIDVPVTRSMSVGAAARSLIGKVESVETLILADGQAGATVMLNAGVVASLTDTRDTLSLTLDNGDLLNITGTRLETSRVTQADGSVRVSYGLYDTEDTSIPPASLLNVLWLAPGAPPPGG